MAEASKSFPLLPAPSVQLRTAHAIPLRKKGAVWLPLVLVYGLIEIALWTPVGHLNQTSILAAALSTLLFTWFSPFSWQEMGVSVPSAGGSGRIVLGAAVLAAMVPLFSMSLGYDAGPVHVLPLGQACAYSVWALVQQFLLQSFFFVRLETLFGGARAVVITALLFAGAHFPNHVLALASLVAGLFFCEMFRRYRNIFPLGLVHAGLGLLMAASFSDSVLRDMRVGIGFLSFQA